MLRYLPLLLALLFFPTFDVQAQDEKSQTAADATAAGEYGESKSESDAKSQDKATDEESAKEADASDENAEEDKGSPLAGHSYHGEVFNEGPRQAAYLMGNTGNVTFPITTENEMVQKFFNQGVGQLHGFWYLEAERSFRQVASIEPECAMAYWGMAMANTSNKDRAKGFVKKAFELKDKVSKREKMYIEALHKWYEADTSKSTERAEKYTDALEKIIYEHPEDLEAKAFLGLQLWLNRRYKLKIQSHLAVDALLQQVLAKNPLHPCHHYVIHLWDHERSENALVAAATCGKSAPGIAHMWHMPGHIYSDLQRYEDAVWQQEASARVDHAHMMRDQVLPDQISNFAHNNEWLIRNLIKLGRVEDGLSLARNMIELPQHPKYNNFEKRGSASYGRSRLLDVLNTYEMWDELIAYGDTAYLLPTDKDSEQIKRMRHLGRAWFRKGNADKGGEYLVMLEDALKEKQDEQKKAGDEAAEKAIADAAEKATKAKSEKEEPVSPGDESKEDADKADDQIAEPQQKADAACDDDVADDKKAEPEADENTTAKAAEKARKAAEKKFVGKISNIKNAVSELKGHVALAEANYDEALKLLKKGKDFPAEFRAEIELLAGKKDDAIKTVKKNVDKKKNEVRPLLSQIETLWQCEKKDEAKEAFEKLRKTSGPIDRDLALFKRLDPIAEEMGIEGDWRIEYKVPEDFGWRPELASLGPFRWQGPRARGWVLPDGDSVPRSLADYEGKPVVLIFYLGHGCLHCAEQLKAFAPKAKEFKEAGFEVVAISTDSKKDLKQSQENYGGVYPFPLVADPSLEVFRDYRVYDDFEKQPLHGTFLIDAEGRVRWHDISYEPFMEPDFVLKEGRRLLDQTGGADESKTASR